MIWSSHQFTRSVDNGTFRPLHRAACCFHEGFYLLAERFWCEQCAKHVQERLAKFMGTEESIIYSYDLATIPSVIPAFANAKDVIVCDEVSAKALMPRVTKSSRGETMPSLQEGVTTHAAEELVGRLQGSSNSTDSWCTLYIDVT